ncbi:hypothetical protein FRC06_006391 [Ceratobasidium sp. 370]|nr:hypothetical protein FRC06_006391 [Ceratobasidium sp. 370]
MVPVLRTILEARVAEENQDGAQEHIRVADVVEHQLWLNQLLKDLRRPIEEVALDILWDNLLEVVAGDYGNVQPDVVHREFRRLSLFQRLKYRILGKNVIQFSRIWNEGLRAALPAAHQAGKGQYHSGMTHGEMFDIAFRAGVDAALEAVKKVVQETQSDVDAKRNEMWEYVWTVWDEVWKCVHLATRDKVIALIETTLADLVGWVAGGVVKELGDNDRQKVQATIRFKRKLKLRVQDEEAELSLEAFQRYIEKIIQSVPGQTLERRAHIEEAMSNAWDVSRKTYRRLNSIVP